MEDTPLVSMRRRLLKQEVDAHGNAEIARAAGKPDRQINDLIHGRASFGDRIARQLEKIRPDLPAGWLLLGPNQAEPLLDQQKNVEHLIAARSETQTRKTLRQASELLSLWLELPANRREELIAALRTELGKDVVDDIGLVVPARARRQSISKIKTSGQ